jgi:hypothetical protein
MDRHRSLALRGGIGLQGYASGEPALPALNPRCSPAVQSTAKDGPAVIAQADHNAADDAELIVVAIIKDDAPSPAVDDHQPVVGRAGRWNRTACIRDGCVLLTGQARMGGSQERQRGGGNGSMDHVCLPKFSQYIVVAGLTLRRRHAAVNGPALQADGRGSQPIGSLTASVRLAWRREYEINGSTVNHCGRLPARHGTL